MTPAQLEALSKGRKIAWRLPKTAKQIKHIRELSKRPGTQFTAKQLENARRKDRVSANSMIKHHNDLCHGAKDADDTTHMIMREHARLHAKLRVENGTHPWLAKNRENKLDVEEAPNYNEDDPREER